MPTKNWPHPVLDSQTNDYPNCAFQATFEIEQSKLAYTLRAEFDLGCDSLEDSILKGDAKYLLHVGCVRTAYREVFGGSSPKIEVSIPEHELRDTFTVSPYIVASKTHQLSSAELADTFKGLTFNLSPGAVLAAAPSVDFFAEKVFDELKNISAIFQVVKHHDPKSNAVEYDLTAPKITIALPAKAHADYLIFRARRPYRETFVCSLVLPGLMLALEMIQAADESDGDDSLRWKRVLKKKLKDAGKATFAKDDILKISQALLEYPHMRAFHAIREKESNEN